MDINIGTLTDKWNLLKCRIIAALDQIKNVIHHLILFFFFFIFLMWMKEQISLSLHMPVCFDRVRSREGSHGGTHILTIKCPQLIFYYFSILLFSFLHAGLWTLALTKSLSPDRNIYKGWWEPYSGSNK